MTKEDEWPVDVQTTGSMINEISTHLEAGKNYSGVALVITREQLEGWLDCIVYCAALLDPDNQPLTKEQLEKFQLKRP